VVCCGSGPGPGQRGGATGPWGLVDSSGRAQVPARVCLLGFLGGSYVPSSLLVARIGGWVKPFGAWWCMTLATLIAVVGVSSLLGGSGLLARSSSGLCWEDQPDVSISPANVMEARRFADGELDCCYLCIGPWMVGSQEVVLVRALWSLALFWWMLLARS